MRPILLKGHERSITCLKYNREGDLLFTTSKAPGWNVWYSDNGERLGTYEGHTGAVWTVDVDSNTEYVLSGSADTFVKLWQVETGRELNSWTHKTPVRSVGFSAGNKTFLSVTDQVLGHKPTVCIWDLQQPGSKPILEITGRNELKILSGVWGPSNNSVVTANEDGTVRIYDLRKAGEQLHVIADHDKSVTSVSFSADGLLFATSSKDGNAKLYDSHSYKNLKTYKVGRPINSVSISPLKEELIVGGGQEASTVTTTRVDSSQFKVKFYHLIYEEEIGSVAGHFGPVNVLSYAPDGESFASGGEDGFIRLHHFDPDYFTRFGKSD